MKLIGFLIEDTQTVYVNIPKTGDYVVGTKESHHAVPNGSPAILGKDDKLFLKMAGRVSFDGYRSEDTHEVISLFEYEQRRQELTKNATYNEYEVLEFPTNAEKHAYELFEDDFIPCEKQLDGVLVDVELDLTQVVMDTGSRYILPIWTVPTIESKLRLYQLDCLKLFVDVYSECTRRYNIFCSSLPTNGLPSSIRIGDIFYNTATTFNLYGNTMVQTGLLHDLKKAESTLKKAVDDIFKYEYEKANNKPIPNLQELDKFLSNLDGRLKELPVKSIGNNAHQQLKQLVRDFQKNIRQETLE